MKKRKLGIVLFGFLGLLLAVGVWVERRPFYDVAEPEELARIMVNEVIPGPLGWFHEHVGRYPTTEEGLEVLFVPPFRDRDLWRGPYIESKTPTLDPWGEPFQYLSPGERNPSLYDLFSLGTPKTGHIGNWGDSNKSEMPTP